MVISTFIYTRNIDRSNNGELPANVKWCRNNIIIRLIPITLTWMIAKYHHSCISLEVVMTWLSYVFGQLQCCKVYSLCNYRVLIIIFPLTLHYWISYGSWIIVNIFKEKTLAYKNSACRFEISSASGHDTNDMHTPFTYPNLGWFRDESGVGPVEQFTVT